MDKFELEVVEFLKVTLRMNKLQMKLLIKMDGSIQVM